MNGYLGTNLHVDLNQTRLWDEALNEEYARKFVGGSGLAVRYLHNLLDTSIDPLGPDNPLYFLTGSLVGTSMTSTERDSVCASSPLPGIWDETNSGGLFGLELRYAGVDGVLVTCCLYPKKREAQVDSFRICPASWRVPTLY